MPIDFKHKFIFVHIPKCAGVTIEKFFDIESLDCLHDKNRRVVNRGVSYALQHLTPELIKSRTSKFDEYFKFTFVRNPFDRVISEYFWRHKESFSETGNKHFESWFNEFYEKIDIDHKIHQYKYTDGVDFIGHVETFNKDFNHVLDTIGYKGDRKAKKHSVTKKKRITMSKKVKDRIRELYDKDFKMFGYEK